MTRFFVVGALTLFLIFSVYHIIVLRERKEEARVLYGDAEKKLNNLQREEAELNKELEYYANPLNLEKELRARFNYKLPGERTIIFVPQSTSSDNASGSSR